jgi:RNA polymerase sigma factor (sigma-70 family)
MKNRFVRLTVGRTTGARPGRSTQWSQCRPEGGGRETMVMGPMEEDSSGQEVDDPPLRPVAGIVQRVWCRSGAALSSDVREDCELEATLTLWQVRDRVKALPAAERDAYAATCVRHRLQQVLRRERQQRAWDVSLELLRTENGPALDLADTRAVPWDDLIAGSLLDQLGRSDLFAAVHALPARDRDVLDLYYARELTDAEIAGLVDSTPAAVKVQRNRALSKLRQWLGRAENREKADSR